MVTKDAGNGTSPARGAMCWPAEWMKSSEAASGRSFAEGSPARCVRLSREMPPLRAVGERLPLHGAALHKFDGEAHFDNLLNAIRRYDSCDG